MLAAWRFSVLVVFVRMLDCVSPASAAGSSISIPASQHDKLVRLVQFDDEAARCFETIQRAADAALAAEPNPIADILSEGKLPGDPNRIKTQASLHDMEKLDALGLAYAVTGDVKYAAKAREFTLAWATVNHSAGDPIDDTKLEPLIVAYDLTRLTAPESDQKIVDDYLREVVAKEEQTAKRTHNNGYNNWNSHRLKVIGLIAFVLKDKPVIERVVGDFKEQIDHNINADGSTYDFHERDALHYHIYDLEPLLTLAIAARNNDIDLYSYQGKSGGSLGKGIAFLRPYADGTQQHAEFVHSKVAFDRQRAEAGDAHYKAGSAFDPKSAVGVLESDELLDASLLPLVTKLRSSTAQRFPSWEIVLNAARQ